MAPSRPNSSPENALFIVLTCPSRTTWTPFRQHPLPFRPRSSGRRRRPRRDRGLAWCRKSGPWAGCCIATTTAGLATRLMSAMAPSVCDGAPAAVIGRFFSAFSESISILRRLHHDRIGHAVVGIEPIGRRDLAAAGEIDHQAVGHVALGDADILGARAVDIDVEAGAAERLLDARVDQTRNMPQPAQQFLRIGVIRRQIGPADLQVDRRGRAEIQDLADDVGRQERERHSREARRQLLAQVSGHSPRSAGGPP